MGWSARVTVARAAAAIKDFIFEGEVFGIGLGCVCGMRKDWKLMITLDAAEQFILLAYM